MNERQKIDSLKDAPELDRLYDDIRTEVSRDLRHFRAREEQLSAMAPDELLMMYMNWKFRQIHPHPRKVLLSTELLNRKQTNDALLKPVEKQFEQLVEMIVAGDDLTPLLSPNILYKPYELTPDFRAAEGRKAPRSFAERTRHASPASAHARAKERNADCIRNL